MIARIFPDTYDAEGRSVLRPDLRRRGVKPTFPFGRFFSRPLTVNCESIRDIRKFLSTCTALGDKEHFGKEDYWQPPDEFEQTRKGDCDCYALWTWRQLLSMGYQARFVLGRSGQYGTGHAWVTFIKDDQYYLVEPQFWFLGERMPTLSTARYKPMFSVVWDGQRAHWYQHKQQPFRFDNKLPVMLAEWLRIWGRFWMKFIPRIPLTVCRRVQQRFRQ